MPSIQEEQPPKIRWSIGDLIGSGPYARVFRGTNLDSGELLAIKQILVPASEDSEQKIEACIRELEEEVKLAKNLSHPNIARYLGKAREADTFNILMEYVPGGSIALRLQEFGSLSESVVRMYTKQLLLELEYLHRNGLMHRNIKGSNIFVDNTGCIKLADFCTFKAVFELATSTRAKTIKYSPYWMAPNLFIELAIASLWIYGALGVLLWTWPPENLLGRSMRREPTLRASLSELLQHPFVTG